jgi:hypothetical protein
LFGDILLRRQLWVLSFICFFILASVPTALCRSPAPTVYVAGDSSGAFKCDGKSDQVQINQALKLVADNPKYTTVHLKGPHTYIINDTLLIGSNTILEGDSTAVIKLANNASWVSYKPLIKQMSSSGNNNIIIRGFEVNVNRDGNPEIPAGRGYYNIIHFTNCNNIKVYNMYMHDGLGDGLRIESSKNIQFYNNRVDKLGHDGLFAIRSESAAALPVHVLSADLDILGFAERFRHFCNSGKRRDDDDIHLSDVADVEKEGMNELGRLGLSHVHLPVGGDDFFSHRLRWSVQAADGF